MFSKKNCKTEISYCTWGVKSSVAIILNLSPRWRNMEDVTHHQFYRERSIAFLQVTSRKRFWANSLFREVSLRKTLHGEKSSQNHLHEVTWSNEINALFTIKFMIQLHISCFFNNEIKHEFYGTRIKLSDTISHFSYFVVFLRKYQLFELCVAVAAFLSLHRYVKPKNEGLEEIYNFLLSYFLRKFQRCSCIDHDGSPIVSF